MNKTWTFVENSTEGVQMATRQISGQILLDYSWSQLQISLHIRYLSKTTQYLKSLLMIQWRTEGFETRTSDLHNKNER